MAGSTTAVLSLLGLLLASATAGARGAESDPARRSLVVDAVERASPAVVNISTEQVVERRASPFPFRQDPFFDEFFRDFVDPRPQRYKTTSLGSGVIVAADGTIVTNVHVIQRASRIHVTLADQREFDAKLVGADADVDIAVVRVDAGGPLPFIALGTSSDLMIGESVIAIGNPFGLSHTVTTGVVSALGRSLHEEERTYTDFIQTDASINPGNSGGPLLNIKGELIGINSAIYGKAQGIGFAIPVDRTRRVMKDLVSYGEVRRAWIGLVVQELTPDLAQHFGARRGVVVAEVEAKSPADAAGFARGDAILKVDGHDVGSREEFEQRVEDHGEGDRIALTRRRDGRDEDVEVKAAIFPTARADELAWKLFGFDAAEDDDGLVVRRVRPGSPAARIGMQRSDRVLGLGGTPLRTLAELRRRIIEVRAARSVLLSVGRGAYQYNVQVPLERG
ncbi:MAG TPA: trypsin-like peptidase domain-containing protein [Candidatus Binatia bacterium]|nr:trypsin-like peptidase domain-containing protein [Candidatus Binatia bacterium]